MLPKKGLPEQQLHSASAVGREHCCYTAESLGAPARIHSMNANSVTRHAVPNLSPRSRFCLLTYGGFPLPPGPLTLTCTSCVLSSVHPLAHLVL